MHLDLDYRIIFLRNLELEARQVIIPLSKIAYQIIIYTRNCCRKSAIYFIFLYIFLPQSKSKISKTKFQNFKVPKPKNTNHEVISHYFMQKKANIPKRNQMLLCLICFFFQSKPKEYQF
jgi:hypothetical protein